MIKVVTISVEELESIIDAAFQRNMNNIVVQASDGLQQGGANSPYVTKKEAARILGCSQGTIDNFARAGRLKRHYLGKKNVLFEREQVLEIIKPRK